MALTVYVLRVQVSTCNFRIEFKGNKLVAPQTTILSDIEILAVL